MSLQEAVFEVQQVQKRLQKQRDEINNLAKAANEALSASGLLGRRYASDEVIGLESRYHGCVVTVTLGDGEWWQQDRRRTDNDHDAPENPARGSLEVVLVAEAARLRVLIEKGEAKLAALRRLVPR